MRTVLGLVGLVMIVAVALLAFIAPIDQVLVDFHWTVLLAIALFGLVLLLIDIAKNGDC